MPRLKQYHRSRRAFPTIIAVLLLLALDPGLRGVAALAQTTFDSPEVRATADVVPPALLRGAHYQLGPTVSTFTFMNQYSVTSDYGPFSPPSDARLRRLVREIAAIAELQKIHQSDAFAKATVEAGKGVVQGAQHLINDPVATIGAVPEAVFSVFGRVSEAAKRGGRSKYEDGVAQNLLAVSSFKREYAQKFDIDVYSSNEVLQKELNSIAWASAAGNLTLGAASMATGAVVLQVASGVRTLEQAKSIVNALPATELSRRNREALRQMRVPDPVADRFLENRLLSPRHQTVIVEAMTALRGIPGRSAFIQYAARADSEDAALLFQEMAELLADYHRSVAPIQRLDIYLNIPIAYTGQGSAVILLPIDRLLWTERTSGIATSLGQTLPKPQPVRKIEVWMTGDASDRAHAGLQQLGITLIEHAGQRLPLLD
ncbi:MAG TPA: hypothetical protein VJX94_15580 [Stellaceae bacterium]|nr:hypothetical protein [Stellaceae bacterium]